MVSSLIELVRVAATLLTVLIFARVVVSWVAPAGENPLVQWIYRLTEPVLRPVRSLLPAMGGMDFSPILVLIGIQIAEQLLIRVLIGMADTGS